MGPNVKFVSPRKFRWDMSWMVKVEKVNLRNNFLPKDHLTSANVVPLWFKTVTKAGPNQAFRCLDCIRVSHVQRGKNKSQNFDGFPI